MDTDRVKVHEIGGPTVARAGIKVHFPLMLDHLAIDVPIDVLDRDRSAEIPGGLCAPTDVVAGVLLGIREVSLDGADVIRGRCVNEVVRALNSD